MAATALASKSPEALRASAARRGAATRLVWLLVAVLGVAAALYVGICSYMALTLTRPDRKPFAHTPEEYGLVYQDVTFPSRVDQLTLRGWLLEPPAGAPARQRPVVMVHGKGTDRSSGPGGGILSIAAPLVRQGYPVLTFDLRGSGQSAGERFTLGIQEVRDVGGAVDFLRARGVAPDGVYVQGFSMGAATALLFAPNEPLVRAVVEDSGYADLDEILDVQVPKQGGLPPAFTPGMLAMGQLLLGLDLHSVRPVQGMPALAQRHVPLLVIQGLADDYVPPSNGERLAAAYGSGVDTLYVPGAGHVLSHSVAPDLYLARLEDFLARAGS